MSFILPVKTPKMFCFAQSAGESTLTVQTKAVSVVPLVVFSPRRTPERKCCHCSDLSFTLVSTALGSHIIWHNPYPRPGVVPGNEFSYTTKNWCLLQTIKSRLKPDMPPSFSLCTTFYGAAEICRTVHGINYYSINQVQWLPSERILLVAWVVSIISMDRGQQIWELGLHLLLLLLLFISAFSQRLTPSIGSTVGFLLNRCTASAIISFRKSMISRGLGFYSSCIRIKPPAYICLNHYCVSGELSSAQPALRGKRCGIQPRALPQDAEYEITNLYITLVGRGCPVAVLHFCEGIPVSFVILWAEGKERQRISCSSIFSFPGVKTPSTREKSGLLPVRWGNACWRRSQQYMAASCLLAEIPLESLPCWILLLACRGAGTYSCSITEVKDQPAYSSQWCSSGGREVDAACHLLQWKTNQENSPIYFYVFE